MQNTPNLALPYLMAAQAQKHVTHNEALRMLDAVTQLSVLSRSLSSPPVSKSDGDRFIIKPTASGEWVNRDGQVAAWQDDSWMYYNPKPGWIAHVADENLLAYWDGAAWVGLDSNNAPIVLGINASADTTNRLAVKSDAVLFSHDDVTPGTGDQRVILNKAAVANTTSLLFQTDYSGRAEFGLTGDDNIHIKVSPDGGAWFEGIVINKDTGAVSFPNTDFNTGSGRELLTSHRTYYVRVDGDDTNDGLSNDSGGAFQTIQRAIDVTASLDMGIYDVTIKVADGTYATNQSLKTYLGAGRIIIEGNVASPSNVVINAPDFGFGGNFTGLYEIKGFEINSAIYGIFIGGGDLEYQALNFGPCAIHIYVTGARVTAIGAYEISGDANRHIMSSGPGSIIRLANIDLTLTGTVNFPTAFAHAEEQGQLRPTNVNFIGSATGRRFISERLGLIQTNGQSEGWLPGNVSGISRFGGLYT